MQTADYIAALRRDGEAFADAASTADLTARVPSCPDWNVADLVYHLTEVHQFWRTIVSTGAMTWEGIDEPPRAADDQLVATFRAGLDEVVAVLASADPAASVWTWSDDHTVGFVIRRMAQETAIHRCDADEAAGAPIAIEAALASDGIDEFLHHFLNTSGNPEHPVAGSVHIHCGDVPGEWTMRPSADGFDVTREHAKGDCALRGAASDLLLALWRRRPLDTIDVVGDRDVAARFVAASRLD